jgi:hypothetical protein
MPLCIYIHLVLMINISLGVYVYQAMYIKRSSIVPRSMQSQKLSNVRKGRCMGDQSLLSRAPSCFGSQVKLLVPLHLQSLAPTPFTRRVERQAGRRS